MSADAASRMDQQYRYQRYVYDWSRKYYLLGREQILREIKLTSRQNLLEVGCGTGSNLYKLAYHFPLSKFYGLDASALMLESARANTRYKRFQNIHFQQGLAQQFTAQQFNVANGFDHILMSYTLSMIPDWELAVGNALQQLKPGGCLHIVDFSDQVAMPGWFRHLLLKWLDWFHVRPNPELPVFIRGLEQQTGATVNIRHTPGRYALIIHCRKPGLDNEKHEEPQLPSCLKV
ncbi:MAG: class I SAM-dependent methyltransferase [Thiolinea sp.]